MWGRSTPKGHRHGHNDRNVCKGFNSPNSVSRCQDEGNSYSIAHDKLKDVLYQIFFVLMILKLQIYNAYGVVAVMCK